MLKVSTMYIIDIIDSIIDELCCGPGFDTNNKYSLLRTLTLTVVVV